MTKKIIPFEINLKSSQRAGFTFQPRPQILTNDANAAELNFIITDANSGELTGATATVLLFMKDGSFFQNTDVTRVNNTFVYTIKPNQAKHKGVAQAQLVVKQGTVENASPLMEFEIIGGLETKPIVERDIQDWTSLTAEAKAFVDQIEDFTLESFVENKMGEELANLEVNYAGRLTGLESADQSITAQLAQTATKNELFLKRDKATKIEPTDASDALLQMFSPAGSTNPIVAPNSVDANKTTFIREQKNIFNKTTVSNGYINFLTGAVMSSELYKASDYIPVIYGRIYKTTKCYDYAFYNSSKTFISAISNGNIEATVIPPINAVYLRTAVANANLNTTMISEYSLPTEYLAFGERKIIMIDEAFISAIKETVPQSSESSIESKWSNKTWNAIGDSITEVNGRTGKNYHKYISDKIGCVVNNYGISGTGWRTGNADGSKLPFSQRLDAMSTSADLITVFGGTNDYGEVGTPFVLGTLGDTTMDTFYGAVDYTLRLLIAKYPTKTIAVFTPLPSGSFWATKSYTMEQVADAIIQVANRHSIPVLDLFRENNLNINNTDAQAYYFKDATNITTLHPNTNGHGKLADKILSFINSL